MKLMLERTCALAAVAILAACASEPPMRNPSLDEALSMYQGAIANPQVARSGAIELQKARVALFQADTALNRNDTQTVEHYSAVAKRSTEAALQAAKMAAENEAARTAEAGRKRVLISTRTKEAETQQTRESAQAKEGRSRELASELAALHARKTARGMVLTLEDVLFDTGSAVLDPRAYHMLDQISALLKEHPQRVIQIEGFTDSVGSAEYNQSLSERRAYAVKDALVSRGVDPDRMSARGFGEGMPEVSNDTAEGRQQNRRVEIVIPNRA